MNNLLIEFLIAIMLFSLLYSYPSLFNYISLSREENLINKMNSDINFVCLKTMIKREAWEIDLLNPKNYRLRGRAYSDTKRIIDYPTNLYYTKGNTKHIRYSPNGMPSFSGNFTLRGKDYDYNFIMRVAERKNYVKKERYVK